MVETIGICRKNIEIVEISMLHGQDLQVINLHLLLIQGIDIIFIINIIEYQRLGSVQDYNRFHAEAVWQFNKAIVDATYDLIPAVKPQVAMYEQFGVPGMAAYEKTVSYCQEKGLVVIGDIKRGDIGSTSEAYAVGHLGHVQVGSKSYAGFHEDFATVNPYLGSDGVKPFIKVCKEEKKGIFVLVKTSNPSSGEFQDRIIDGRPLYESRCTRTLW